MSSLGYAQMLRTPTGGGVTYATWDPGNSGSNITLSNGNLTAAGSGSTGSTRCTIGKSSGKWYWEIACDLVGILFYNNGCCDNLFDVNTQYPGSLGGGADSYAYSSNGGGSLVQGGSILQSSIGSPVNGDIIGIALDIGNSIVQFYKNGSPAGTPLTSSDITFFTPSFAVFGINGFAGTATANFGQNPFSYGVPAGYNPGIYT